MTKGYLSLVLHAHLPFVHHPESESYMEERWLFEAITETYIPLLDVFEGLIRDAVDFRVTMSLTPSLLSMLGSPLLQTRYIRHMDNLIMLADKECERTKEDEAFAPLAAMYAEHFTHIRSQFIHRYGGNLINGFRALQDSGHLELITSSATHAFLPYVRTEQALRAQIENAVRLHTAVLGKRPRGIWLPECGFQEGLDRILSEYGLQFFFTDTHSLLHADPQPQYGVFGPVVTPSGVAAFARDQETSKQVWSSQEGYPGDYDYREYYRDIGYDLEYDYIKPYLHESGIRLNTGMKYYRITGKDGHKEPYHPAWAKEKAASHAGNFMFCREKQAEHLFAQSGRKPIIVASYDAELFGHWWYEGPMWIDYLCRKIHHDQQTIRMITPADYLLEYPENQQCRLSFSSWGRAGYGEVWLGQDNEWVYRHLHRMEDQMIELAGRFADASGLQERALNQAARELMLAQSSDWAFIMDNRTTVEYAIKRIKSHISRFLKICRDLRSDSLDEKWLAEAERRDAIFPDADYRIYMPERAKELANVHAPEQGSGLRVLMLTWEFPPMTVGGLSRHVYDLSRKLVMQGTEVHVITSHVDGYPAYEINQGVHVHRVKTYQAQELQFMEWIFQLNLAMADYGKDLLANYGPFDLIHAHDWLVGHAAKMLKSYTELPLVATIHATEHGRNRGLHTELQRSIHHLEWQLTYEAWRVIVCSHYMEEEVKGLFQLPGDKIDMVPNGVDLQLIRVGEKDAGVRERFALPHEKIVFFVGRLVHEKGVHTLLASIPEVISQFPDAKFVIGGKGPLLDELKQRVQEMKVDSKVAFTGFIDDETRNQLLGLASAAVFPSLYEPFGIVALEAMALGAPVIVSDVGGLGEIVSHGEDGYKVIPGDVPSLVLHIVKMLKEEDAAGAMAERALHKVEARYDWEAIASQTLDTYRQVAHKKINALGYREAAATR
ncbi:1,4-alpha-glucan branching protein domain-containing protein [Paenibacillus sp. MBLB4367]|uniref:1,4-alpha-glucan branching protein domain-containing protein n=1 Tax=Paenibacillus sp. MBLB4367 TaxID=3384767 RepID=UPI0039083E6B